MLHRFGLLSALLSPPLPNNPENQNFEKKKSPGDIIILHLCIYHK